MSEPKRHTWYWNGQPMNQLMYMMVSGMVAVSFDNGYCSCFNCNEYDFINGLS